MSADPGISSWLHEGIGASVINYTGFSTPVGGWCDPWSTVVRRSTAPEPTSQHTSRWGETLACCSLQCLDVVSAVQDYTLPHLEGMARDGRRQVLRPLASVASPDHQRCCIAVVLLLMCAWTVLNSTELPSHGITLAHHEAPKDRRDTVAALGSPPSTHGAPRALRRMP
jgi:hypothetical protein